jgi:phosphoglycolate phosphatase-like HAD superfamily hydrolase
MAKLLLFDVDGTLVLTGGAGVRAFNRAFHATFGVEGGLAEVPFAGRTDRWIVTEALRRAGVAADEEALDRFRRAYLVYLSEEIGRPGPRKGVMPGVRELLDELAPDAEVHLALLTGNYAGGAEIKLAYFDLWRYFRCGAFADDAEARHELVPVALSRARTVGRCEVALEDVVVIGDTPLDVECARAAGVRSIAVATGGFDAEALRRCGADVVFEDLTDAEAFRRALLF